MFLNFSKIRGFSFKFDIFEQSLSTRKRFFDIFWVIHNLRGNPLGHDATGWCKPNFVVSMVSWSLRRTGGGSEQHVSVGFSSRLAGVRVVWSLSGSNSRRAHQFHNPVRRSRQRQSLQIRDSPVRASDVCSHMLSRGPGFREWYEENIRSLMPRLHCFDSL